MTENSTLTEYYLPKRKIVYGLALASATMALSPLVLQIAFSGRYIGDSGSWLVVTILFGSFAVWTFLWGFCSKLVLSTNGIELHDIANLLSVRTEWSNISEIQTLGSRTLLILKEPAVPTSKLSAWLFSKGFIIPIFVNISDYKEYWQNGKLKNDFAKYAPFLL